MLIVPGNNGDTGRTGRFGRKGVSINFVHDQRTWQQMSEIEKALGKEIIQVPTADLDSMEEVRFTQICLCPQSVDSRFLTYRN